MASIDIVASLVGQSTGGANLGETVDVSSAISANSYVVCELGAIFINASVSGSATILCGVTTDVKHAQASLTTSSLISCAIGVNGLTQIYPLPIVGISSLTTSIEIDKSILVSASLTSSSSISASINSVKIVELTPSHLLGESTFSASITMDSNLVSSIVGTSKMTVTLARDIDHTGVCHVVDEIMSLWGVEVISSVSTKHHDRAINILNASMQMLWSDSAKNNYWTATRKEVSIPAFSDEFAMSDELQNVTGAVRLKNSKKTLTKLTALSEFENYAVYFHGHTGRGDLLGEPEAYYVDRTGQNAEDPAKVVLKFAPTPEVDTDILVEVVNEPAHYEWDDYCQCSEIQIPHKYVESILIPICKYKAMSSRLFFKPDLAGSIVQEYNAALTQLGMNDPITQNDNDNSRTSTETP